MRGRVSERSEPLIPPFNESPWLYRPYEMTITFPFNGHFVDGGASPPNEVRVVGKSGTNRRYLIIPQVFYNILSCLNYNIVK